MAEMGFRAFFPPDGTAPPPADGSSLPVAYSLLASSRLGYSPKMAYHRAYHTTFRKRGSNTNFCFRQKICGLTSRGPAAPLDPTRSPVAAAHSPAGEAAANCPLGIPHHHCFHHLLNPKRTNYMSNLTFPLPSLMSTPRQALSQPCGALAVQPCLAPVPSPPQPSTPLSASQSEKPATAPVSPMPVARCSVKGCVFPRFHPGSQSMPLPRSSAIGSGAFSITSAVTLAGATSALRHPRRGTRRFPPTRPKTAGRGAGGVHPGRSCLIKS